MIPISDWMITSNYGISPECNSAQEKLDSIGQKVSEILSPENEDKIVKEGKKCV